MFFYLNNIVSFELFRLNRIEKPLYRIKGFLIINPKSYCVLCYFRQSHQTPKPSPCSCRDRGEQPTSPTRHSRAPENPGLGVVRKGSRSQRARPLAPCLRSASRAPRLPGARSRAFARGLLRCQRPRLRQHLTRTP